MLRGLQENDSRPAPTSLAAHCPFPCDSALDLRLVLPQLPGTDQRLHFLGRSLGGPTQPDREPIKRLNIYMSFLSIFFVSISDGLHPNSDGLHPRAGAHRFLRKTSPFDVLMVLEGSIP